MHSFLNLLSLILRNSKLHHAGIQYLKHFLKA